jgi:hypothetical protein
MLVMARKFCNVLGVTLLTLCCYCGLGPNEAEDTARLECVLSSAKGLDHSLGKALMQNPSFMAKMAAVGIDSAQKASFTPTSFKIFATGISIFDSIMRGANGYELIGGGRQIDIEISRQIDLIGPNGINELFSKGVQVTPDKHGTYIGAKMAFHDTALVSGSLTVGGKQYSFSDVPVAFIGGTQFIIPVGTDPLVIGNTLDTIIRDFPTPDTTDTMVIHDTTYIDPTVVLRVVFDASFCCYLANGIHIPPTWTPGPRVSDDSARVYTNTPVLLPYVGKSEPVVSKYRIDLTNDSTFEFIVTTIGTTAEDIQTIGWAIVFSEHYREGILPPLYSTCGLAMLCDENSDGSWLIRPDPLFDQHNNPGVGYEGQLKFSAFRTTNHTGTCAFYADGWRNYTYNATKL